MLRDLRQRTLVSIDAFLSNKVAETVQWLKKLGGGCGEDHEDVLIQGITGAFSLILPKKLSIKEPSPRGCLCGWPTLSSGKQVVARDMTH